MPRYFSIGYEAFGEAWDYRFVVPRVMFRECKDADEDGRESRSEGCFMSSNHPRYRDHVERWWEECKGVVSDSCLPDEKSVWNELVSDTLDG